MEIMQKVRLWHNLGYFPGICLEGPRKGNKTCQDSRGLGQFTVLNC
jgi:hypothetical protein